MKSKGFFFRSPPMKSEVSELSFTNACLSHSSQEYMYENLICPPSHPTSQDNPKKNTHHNTCLATSGFWRSCEGASLGDITTWLWRPLHCIFKWTFGKMDDSHFYHILLINKKRNIFQLKTNLKKLPPCSQCPPRWCFVQSSPAVHPQHFECLSGRQVHLPQWHRRFCQGSFDVISPGCLFFWGEGIEEKFSPQQWLQRNNLFQQKK